MLRIILVNSNKISIEKSRSMVAHMFMEKDIPYLYYKFNKNDKELENYISNKNKDDIFVIVDSKDINSVDIVNKIRKKYHNISPFIIIVNSLDKKRLEELRETRLYNTEIIPSLFNHEKRIKQIVNDVIECFNENQECLEIKQNKMLYKIPYNDILYIVKESNSKKCEIHCKTETLKFYISIDSIKNLLGKQFIQTHRSAIVNKNNIISANLENGFITFNNNKEEYLISRNYKKIIKNMFPKQGMKVTK